MSLNNAANINYLWANLLIEEFVRNGVEYFCCAPGSRSAPLAVAVAENKRAKSFVHFDERGLAFHALGYVCATRKPAVLICTSGTAVANFLPAVIEASKKKLPLIVLSADRPPELRQTGAMQTIDQVNIFGSYVRWQTDLPCPTEAIKPQFVLTTVDQAVFRCKGELPGPVHINCMFREPLAATPKKISKEYLQSLKSWAEAKSPFTTYTHARPAFVDGDLKQAAALIKKIKNGLIVVGKTNREESDDILKLAKRLGWPIFPDVSSPLRWGIQHDNNIPYYEKVLRSKVFLKSSKIDGILHLGGRMTSKAFYDFIEEQKIEHYIMVLNHPLRNDPTHQVSLRVHGPIGEFCSVLKGFLPKHSSSVHLKMCRELSVQIHEQFEQEFSAMNEISEPLIAWLVSQHIPKDSGLFLGNSMPVRDFDSFASKDANLIFVQGNRGASGIDGNIASAVGFAEGLKQSVTAVLGDLSFLHDFNSLAMLKKSRQPIVLIVVNNNGGRIFSRLPIAQTAPQFEKFFTTPHGFDFKYAAKMFEVDYAQPKSKNDFVKVYKKGVKSQMAVIVEVRTK